MKNLKIFYILFALLILSLLFSCKKGEDDPAISFRSRDSRLEGKWKISSIEFSYRSKDATSDETSTITYNGGTVTMQETINDTTTKKEYTNFNCTLDISKKGKVTCSQSYTEDNTNNVSSFTSNWYWLNNQKDYIYLDIYFIDFEFEEWTIKELRNKKIVLFYNGSETDYVNTNSSSEEISYTIELEKIK